MRRVLVVVSMVLLVFALVGCNLFEKQNDAILKGQILVNGIVPNKVLPVYISISQYVNNEYEYQETLSVNSATSGVYTLQIPEKYLQQKIRISIDVYSNEYGQSALLMGLLNLTWTVMTIDQVDGVIVAPNLDLYAYGANIVSPENSSTVHLPCEVVWTIPQIPNCNEIDYQLICQSNYFTGYSNWLSPFSYDDGNGKMHYMFDGNTDEGMIPSNSNWFLLIAYNVDGNWIYGIPFGIEVNRY